MKTVLLPHFLITIIMSVALAVVLINVELQLWMAIILTAALVLNVVLFFTLLILKKRVDQQTE
ncbi:hypothetical protein [Pontibacillus marinus]|uniref:Uncharacterized protein n=1 Tax=Pontibacillus marinus BH030004 = DSM 16465 TaxID=1385511 RepID=A0A0A5GEQ5_9BACI|nr:hypothetical protein [Pontibacillus marinus]KGX89595.1 hypothetical protein N783_05615 [Pontibacillus marinus BH030004 = DSM 16465]